MSSVLLQSQDHRDLLDLIDNLRSQGIDNYVDLPQIIVCGDQSAGKSSVLEAISGVHFPIKDTLCTRFATELILRRSETSSIKVSISPDVNRSKAEKAQLQSFKTVITNSAAEFSSVVEQAKEAMGLGTDNERVFSRDVLRVELCGPTQSHLTIVDLPGFFEASNTEQSDEDSRMVKDLVLGYMNRPRSIILAVVSAKNEFVVQQVTKYTRKFDPEGMRTLGLITKPDKIDAGSPTERKYVKLAQNEDVKFRLGWHVLRNRDWKEIDISSLQRDHNEQNFFSRGIWTSVDPTGLGVANLRTRLSRVLKDQISQQLPSLLEDVKKGVQDCQHRLERLGGSRDSPEEQRRYLVHASQEFSHLMRAALEGAYTAPFFVAETGDGYRKRLRAVVQNRLADFSQEMRRDGHNKTIVDRDVPTTASEISRSSFADEVQDLLRQSRGRELPGLFNPLVVGELFNEHCKPWKGLAAHLIDDIFRSVQLASDVILQHVAARDTLDGIRLEITNPELKKLQEHLLRKVEELLAPHSDLHPITYNNYLTESVKNIQNRRKRRAINEAIQSTLGHSVETFQERYVSQSDVSSLFKALVEGTGEEDMERCASMTAIDYMEAYYKVSSVPTTVNLN
jgi:GTP-binding protein EngB required for normal cell division